MNEYAGTMHNYSCIQLRGGKNMKKLTALALGTVMASFHDSWRIRCNCRVQG